ncbi:MAG TPA: hypothetical protein VGJ20_41275 [Xanthobacteraceae bacterium]
MQRAEVIALLRAAAAAVERQPEKLGDRYATSAGAAIHAILATFLDAPDTELKHSTAIFTVATVFYDTH